MSANRPAQASSPAANARLLDPLEFPLHGSRLIEASAGTGKTWTIAALYLRLVLGHGTDGDNGTAFRRPLLPAEILVLTFTRAATKELAERIRSRLSAAAHSFRSGECAADDALLQQLLAAYDDERQRLHAAWLLDNAATAMDDAAIFTIDAWCQRMLREHAFDSATPFDESLLANEDALLADAARDYWRQHCYPLDADAFALVAAKWSQPQQLLEDLRPLLGQPIPPVDGEESLAHCIASARRARSERLTELSAGWVEKADRMQGWIEDALDKDSKGWDRRRLQPRHFLPWFEQLRSWAADPLQQTLELKPAARKRLSSAGMAEARKDREPVALPPEFEALQQLLVALKDLPQPELAVRLHAATHIARRLAKLKREQRQFSFADQLQRLHGALHGTHGTRLRQRILAQFPLAMIDEFQDTSALQFGIFDALYRCASNDPQYGLLLIGDPKQSIYGFRGADIRSYLTARRATSGRHYVLGTNYRSTTALVAAVNSWFAAAEEYPRGAFLFGSGADRALPFLPATAAGLERSLQCGEGPLPALSIDYELELRNADQRLQQFAALCAERIVGWLNDERCGFHAGAGESPAFSRLRPADIAVLVRTGREAAAVQRALRQRGLPSVYLSDRDSVFASSEAGDMLHWLRAAAAPADGQRLRTALATATIGLSLTELARLASDEASFDQYSEQMHDFHRLWRERGVLAMLRRLLHVLDLPARWLASSDGERRLTNVLHLAELLQQASSTADGEQGLIRWLALQINEADTAAEEQVLRLESDADLIQIVTIHKSKGLQYPVVCLPFATSFRAITRNNTSFVTVHDADGSSRLEFSCDDDALATADLVRLQEDLRLFYVALTRACHALWLGFAVTGSHGSCTTHRSAAGYLLAGEAGAGETGWEAKLQALASANDGSPPIAIQPAAAEPAISRWQTEATPAALKPLQDYAADFDRRWTLASFSALVRQLPAMPASGVMSGAGRDQGADPFSPTHVHRPAADEGSTSEPEQRAVRPAVTDVVALSAWYRFPRGSFAGDFLHHQLEWLLQEGGMPASGSALQRRCERAGYGDWSSEVHDWLTAVLATPLPSLGLALQDVHTPLVEMEFWMPCARLSAEAIDDLCQRRLLAGQPRPALPERRLKGMLMGFADLVFEHEGRFWVLDYKSNYLGADAAAYSLPALQAAMAQHRYDVQAVLYLLALHRLLRSRLGSRYAPEHQLGGALYFFIRGLDGPSRGEYAIAADSSLIELIETLDQLVGDAATEAPA